LSWGQRPRPDGSLPRLSRKHCWQPGVRDRARDSLGALNYCACRTDLGLSDGSRRLDIDDDRGLQINQGSCRRRQEGMPFKSAGPLCGRIRPGDELRSVSLAPPQAASSRVSRYSRTDRRVLAMASQSTSSDPQNDACWRRRQSGWHRPQKRSPRPTLLPCSAGPRSQTAFAAGRNREVEWSGTSPSRPSRQNQR